MGVIARDILVEMDEVVCFSLDELNAELLSEQEQPALLPLPSTYMHRLCKVCNDLAVDHDYVHYTMQRKYVGQTVMVKASEDEILIYMRPTHHL